MSDALHSLVAIALAIVGVAIVAVLISPRANTAKVIQAAGSAFGNDLTVAISPVAGSGFGTSANLGYPS